MDKSTNLTKKEYGVLLDIEYAFMSKNLKNPVPLKELFRYIELNQNETPMWKRIKNVLKNNKIMEIYKDGLLKKELVFNLDRLREIIRSCDIYSKTYRNQMKGGTPFEIIDY